MPFYFTALRVKLIYTLLDAGSPRPARGWGRGSLPPGGEPGGAVRQGAGGGLARRECRLPRLLFGARRTPQRT